MIIVRSLLAFVLLTLVAGCSGGTGEEPTTSAAQTTETSAALTPTTSSDVSAAESPVGMVAIGHSALTGEGAGTGGAPAEEFSWATGTNPDVDSIYLRLVATDPAHEGHVANTATGGASSSALATQAELALSQVPTPALAIVATVDGDIRCDGTDDGNVITFGAALEEALILVAEASPETQVLIVSQLGRPSGYATMLEELGATEREAGTGMCDMFDPTTGERNEENVTALTDIIEAYEAEAKRVCESLPNCLTDGGLLASLVENPDFYSEDLNHLNIQGQTWLAESLWPLVADSLALP